MRSDPQVLVVEASAGSGKTYCLSKRYVSLSLALCEAQNPPGPQAGIPIQSILAITFTNKAAWEMKSRILDFLKRIALKQLKSQEARDILKPLGLDENRASWLAFRLMNDVVRQYHYFQVQTIDSFINILLSGCSFKIGLSAHFKIQRNWREYLQLSLDELLDRAADDVKIRGLFEDFVRQYLFLENRSGWFPREDLLNVLSELFKAYNIYQKPLLVCPPGEDAFSRKRKIIALVKELREIVPLNTKKNFLDHINALLADGSGVFDVDDLGSYWAREDFPVNKNAEVSGQLEDLWQRLRRQIHDLCLWEARSMFNPYVALFGEVSSCFARLSQRDDVLFLEELNRRAASLFEDDLVTIEELYLRLAARLQHYLIDEFQDTSLSQWRNMALMVEEALAHGGTLFYVGDKKQAIYSFRGGEARLFDALQSRLASYDIQTASLDKNYRSCPEIIAFNNRVFGLDNLQGFLERRGENSKENKRNDVHFSEQDFREIASVFAHARQSPGKDASGGVVRVVHLEGRVKQERADEVRGRLIPLIKELRGRFALKDIAILTRGNRQLEEITQWLLQEGIDASSQRSCDIKNNPLVGELMNLLVFLHAPADNDAFAQFCLGELMPRATAIGPQALRDFLFECALESKRVKEVRFYQRFREAFPGVAAAFFEDFFQQAGVSPLYELTAGVIHRFGCEKNFPQYQGFFMHLLELIKAHEKEGCDLSSFSSFYESLEGEERFVPMAQIDAVRVLTVHKAKGLEFPVVVLPFLEMDIKAGSGGGDGGQAYMLQVQEQGLELLRIKESYRKFCPPLQERYEQEYRKSFLTELNSVYVALTRAIEELHIFVPGRVGNTVNPASFLIPEDCFSSGTPAAAPRTHQPASPHQKIRPFIGDPWGSLQKEFLEAPPAGNALLARQGQFIHAMLMHVGRVDKVTLRATLKNAWEQARRLYTPGESQEEALERIERFLGRDDVRPFFYLPPETAVFCEKEFVNAYGDSRRIDRLIVGTSEVWVVDFKLSAAGENEHHKQIEEYVNLVKFFYPKHKVSGHVLYLRL
ncbi:MAG: UvrD-helicase domain-containing protein [Candidatus Omnitrophica bacterium]|nr:UvrD-helicase domain-containing protein [Candidatus Omnitrophota bacterium]MDE2010378.1 UvrD-helicase domain-containing protein [Candidatus Omnitrophota bacterium]